VPIQFFTAGQNKNYFISATWEACLARLARVEVARGAAALLKAA
jgi:hypothetical protein